MQSRAIPSPLPSTSWRAEGGGTHNVNTIWYCSQWNEPPLPIEHAISSVRVREEGREEGRVPDHCSSFTVEDEEKKRVEGVRKSGARGER